MIHFLAPRSECWTVEEFLATRGQALIGRVSVVPLEGLAGTTHLPRGTWILAALDQLLPAGLALAAGLHDRLTGAGVRVLNDPRRTLRRYDLLETLHREGLNTHRAVRAGGDLGGLRYPVFVRGEHDHNGALTGLLTTPAELEQGLALTMARGHRLADLLVMEFLDTADRQGTYRKYAAFVVGSRIIARGLVCGSNWMLKARGGEYSPGMLEEERAWVMGNPHEAALRRIAEVARVGYGRIDYAIRKDGGVETWEINLNPTVGRGHGSPGFLPPDLSDQREPTREAWTRGLVDALMEIDTGDDSGAAVPVSLGGIDPAGVELVRPQDPERRLSRWRGLFRPLKPALLVLVRKLSPVLVRLGRLARGRA